jgi:hypothetical protein
MEYKEYIFYIVRMSFKYIFENDYDYLKTIEGLSDHLNKSVAMATLGYGKLNETILTLEGMSSFGNRLLLNNLCAIGGNYLEIGSWKGSTFISALYNNTSCNGTSIDFHQEFVDTVFNTTPAFLENNCKTHLTHGESYELITKDCFSDNMVLDSKYNIYFYDGYHRYIDQYKALTEYYKFLEPIFYYICDDYTIEHVEKGTKDALHELDIQVITEYKLFGNQSIQNSTTNGFWNGFYVALCVKRKNYPQFFNTEKYTHCFGN